MLTDGLPPQDLATERSVLGSLIMDNRLIPTAAANLKPGAFYLTWHRSVYLAACNLYESGSPVDLLTLRSELCRDGGNVGPEVDIGGLVENVATAVNITSHIKILSKLHIRRLAIQKGAGLEARAYLDNVEPSDLLMASENIVECIGDECAAADIEVKRTVKVLTAGELSARFDQHRIYGPQNPGMQVSDFWPRTNAIYRPAKGLLQVVAGIPKHGKSEFVDAISVSMSQKHNWKTLFFSPENFPYEQHMEKLAGKYVGKALVEMSDAEYDKTKAWIFDRFFWIQPAEDEVSLNSLLRIVQETVRTKGIDHVVLDPWNEIEIDRAEYRELEGKALGRALRKCRWIARRLNVLFTVVAHPKNMERLKNGSGYQVPHLYDLYGGSMWPNKVDLGIVLYRHFGKKPYTSMYVRACRNRLWGAPGSVEYEYEYPPGRYNEMPPKEPKKKHTEEKDPESDTDSEW